MQLVYGNQHFHFIRFPHIFFSYYYSRELCAFGKFPLTVIKSLWWKIREKRKTQSKKKTHALNVLWNFVISFVFFFSVVPLLILMILFLTLKSNFRMVLFFHSFIEYFPLNSFEINASFILHLIPCQLLKISMPVGQKKSTFYSTLSVWNLQKQNLLKKIDRKKKLQWRKKELTL